MAKDILQWASSIVSFNPNSDVQTVVETPWSRVLKITSTQGNFYLKQTPKDLFIESGVIALCQKLYGNAYTPELISDNQDLSCFLMRSCGDVTVQKHFETHRNIEEILEGIRVYKSLQSETSPHVESFIKLGVPDHRLDKIPQAYKDVIADTTLLREAGLSDTQIKALSVASTSVTELCDKLSRFKLPACLGHSDFHDNNLILNKDADTISVIDLGETVVDNPILSLLDYFKRTPFRYERSLSDEQYFKIYNTCFDDLFVDVNERHAALELANRLHPVYTALTYSRLLKAIPDKTHDSVAPVREKIKDSLVDFLKLNEPPAPAIGKQRIIRPSL